MSDKIWVSAAMMDSRLVVSIKSEMYPYPEGVEEFSKVSRKIDNGFPVPAECFPPIVYWGGPGKKKKNLPHF